MFELSSVPDDLLQPIAEVLEAALPHARGLRPEDVMVVGAACRDILHHALGHRFPTSATHDLDLALALSSWGVYRSIAAAFPKVGDTGIRFRIAETMVDLLPFGDIEDPEGETQPPTRNEPFSVCERRLAELAARWPGNIELLVREFIVAGATTPGEARRRAVVEALTAGFARHRSR